MLKLETVEGKTVYLNPAHIAAVTPTASRTTRVHLGGELGFYTVKQNARFVAERTASLMGRHMS